MHVTIMRRPMEVLKATFSQHVQNRSSLSSVPLNKCHEDYRLISGRYPFPGCHLDVLSFFRFCLGLFAPFPLAPVPGAWWT